MIKSYEVYNCKNSTATLPTPFVISVKDYVKDLLKQTKPPQKNPTQKTQGKNKPPNQML